MKGKKLITTICIVCVLAILLCIPAFATVTESNGNGYALYNGVKLPNIETVWPSKSDFSSAVIFHYYESDEYYLFFCGEIQYISSTHKILLTNSLGNSNIYRLQLVSGAWSNGAAYGSSFNADLSNRSLVWSFVDILNEDGSVYFAASDPIPLDGYNVIEWDGLLSGNYMEIQSGFSIQRIGGHLNTDVNGVFVVHNSFADDDLITVSGSPVGSYTAYPSIYTANATIYDDTDWVVAYSGGGISSSNALLSVKDSFAFSDTVTIPNGLWVPLASVNGATAYYTPLVAYRTTETPPNEGGGDDDDPQPPAGG